MNRSRYYALLLAASLLTTATACSGTVEAVNDSGVPAQPAPAGGGQPVTSSDRAEGTARSNSPADKQADPLQTLPLNDRGNLVETVGEDSSFNSLDGTDFVDFEAQEVTTDFACTADGAEPAANGQYVAIRFSVRAHPELADSGWPYFAMSNRDFTAWSADGTRVPDPVGNSAGCVAPEELLSSPVDPGGDSSGLIIVDVPPGSGSAAFRIGGFESSYGWEWSWE